MEVYVAIAMSHAKPALDLEMKIIINAQNAIMVFIILRMRQIILQMIMVL